MKIQHIAMAVTIINLVLLIVLLTKLDPATAQQQGQNKTQILRGNGLEITDSTGKLRASITFQLPAEVNGVTYPGGVLLRLINSHGQPSVKIGAFEDGGGLSFSNEANGYIQFSAKKSGGFIKIRNADGKEQVIKP